MEEVDDSQNSGALTWFIPSEDPSLISKNQLLARIVGGLGERAEEEVIFGETEITTRVAVDLQQITQIARQMVTRFGMSEIGPWVLTDPTVQGHHALVAHSLAPPGIRTIPPSPKWLSTSQGCIEAHLTNNRYDFYIDIEVFKLWFLLACFQGASNLYYASFQKNDITEIETIGCSEPVEQGKNSCLYGSENLVWIQQFNDKIIEIKQPGLQLETIYVGNSQSSENVKQIMAKGGEKSLNDPLSFINVQHFWVQLETMRMSKLILGNTPSSDHVLAKLSTLLDMDDREEGWAVIGCRGSSSTNILRL
ncbi:hypothetical protein JHK84_033998 [Glycine max]|nr:hypothetical protein JHK84_033998 [Glycine max]